MHYACIAPTAYLDQYAGRGHFQLCLAQVAMRDPRYFEWYKRRREAGDFVILDNGAYEGELVAPEELTKLALEMQPNVLTIPDMIDNAEMSEAMAYQFCQKNSGPGLMRVFQNASRDVEIWVKMVSYEIRNHHWKWVAFPRALGELRPVIIEACHLSKQVNIHAFGWTGNLNEVRALAKLGVTSIDTSAPVWRGLHNYMIHDTVDQAWETQSGTPFDPSDREEFQYLPHDIVTTIDSNLQAMQRACVAF